MAERRPAATPATVLLLALLAGCRGTTPEPVVRAADQPTKAAPAEQPAPPSTTATATEAPKETEPARDDTPIVVDPGGGDSARPVSLVEAARAERERRARAGEPIAVITDKTLPQYAKKGQITTADVKKKKDAAAPPSPDAAPAQPLHDEAYWRGRALEIRMRWRRAADDTKELEQKSTELRQKFYLESDTFTRDNQIKPEWDRVLDKLRQARLDSEAAQKELVELLEEGRVAGALPGWLREGEEEEPAAPKKKEATPPVQSIEPPVIEPPPQTDDSGERL